MSHSSLLPAFANHLRIERGLSPRTVDGYGRDLFLFFKWAGSEAEVTKDRILAYLAARPSWGAASRARAIAALKTFGAWMADSGHVASDPAGSISTPKIPKRLPKFPTGEEMTAFLSNSGRGNRSESVRDTAIAHMLGSLGLRRTEIVNLDVSQVDRSRWYLRVIGKGDKERSLPLRGECQKAMRAWVAHRESVAKEGEPALFVNDCAPSPHHGTRIGIGIVYEIARRRSSVAFGRPMSPHKFRHGAFTKLHLDGVSTPAIQKIAGHAKIESTMVYVHASEKEIEEALS